MIFNVLNFDLIQADRKNLNDIKRKLKSDFDEEYAERIYSAYLYYKKHYNICANKYSLTVIIPVLNCLKYTKQIISQLKECTYSKLKIIIIDNNSTDGTREFLQTIQDENISCIYNKVNKGFVNIQ